MKTYLAYYDKINGGHASSKNWLKHEIEMACIKTVMDQGNLDIEPMTREYANGQEEEDIRFFQQNTQWFGTVDMSTGSVLYLITQKRPYLNTESLRGLRDRMRMAVLIYREASPEVYDKFLEGDNKFFRKFIRKHRRRCVAGVWFENSLASMGETSR